MSIIVTNELHIPVERAEQVIAGFQANSKGLAEAEGFEGFDLAQPTDPQDDRWLVITHWKDEGSYQAWVDSDHFAKSHKHGSESRKPTTNVVRHYLRAFRAPGN
ncbi:antibiotic biosynthesis monooxygenase family protein [Gleimia hominis]|uniref:antibiotic biosynthesis monooxygenase family protein n=1 Tax=Gleimia hominis TaxID=595468 RepID=UPI000C80085D|nr:antibiotic biosynthesis monooxygenase family protein [Gleimia hominis]WIK64754.1 antibiotic biosynthesis monooxygenase family protein [Gleimia hominis]